MKEKFRIESEKVLERKLKDAVKAKGGLCIKIWCNSFTGFPDRMCLLPGGVIFFAEIKTTNFERSGRQRIVHNQLSRLGFKSYLIDNSLIIKRLTGDELNDAGINIDTL